jgi:hypothetical protein
VVLEAGAPAVAGLQDGDVVLGLAGEDALEAGPVVVCEGELRAELRALAPDDLPGPFGPGAQVDEVGDLGDLLVGPLAAVLVERRHPGFLGRFEDRGANGLGQIGADRVADPCLAASVHELVRGGGGINMHNSIGSMCS